jgi:fucose permease
VGWAGLCFSGIFGLILGEAAEQHPRFVGTALGGVVAAAGVGGALVPWAVGEAAGTALGWRGALALIPACMLLLAVTVPLGGRRTPSAMERV